MQLLQVERGERLEVAEGLTLDDASQGKQHQQHAPVVAVGRLVRLGGVGRHPLLPCSALFTAEYPQLSIVQHGGNDAGRRRDGVAPSAHA